MKAGCVISYASYDIYRMVCSSHFMFVVVTEDFLFEKRDKVLLTIFIACYAQT